MSCQDSEDELGMVTVPFLFLFLKWPRLNISPTPALRYSCLCNWAPEDRCASLGTIRDQALTFTVTITVTVLPASPRNRLSGFCARASLLLAFSLYLQSSSRLAERASKRKAIGGERSQWASLLLARTGSRVEAALQAWDRCAASGVGTMSSIGTGVSLSAPPSPVRR